MSRWVINRVGLLNFWYYQNQIFQLADGRMLLRGTNGSGKSLTMQSLFPVLFDGNTNARRLDSFGSTDRKMEDYLLGEKGVSDRDEGTGYLFLEVKREDRAEYLTIGIGMSAIRGGKLRKWFFAIENNQRIGIDFELFENLSRDVILPFTRKKLNTHLLGIGRTFEKQRDYKNFVNERIFGFDDIEQLDELIDLLINLRSPKLSKEFRPSVIYGILRESLPKLKEDELLTLSKNIEQIDGHRERLEDLSNEVGELTKFAKTYQRWQAEQIGQVSGKWLKLTSQNQQLVANTKNKQQQLDSSNQQLANSQAEQVANQTQLGALEQSIQALNQHEGMNLVLRGQELKEQLADIQSRFQKNESQLARKQKQLLRGQSQLTEQELQKGSVQQELSELLLDNQQYLSFLRLEELDTVYSQKMTTEITKMEVDYWRKEVQKKRLHFQVVIEQLRRLDQIAQHCKELAREVAEIQQQVDELARDLRQWQQTRQGEIENWKGQMEGWQRKISFTVPEQAFRELFYRMDQLLEAEIREELVIEPIRHSYELARSQNQQKMVPLKNQLAELAEKKVEKEQSISEWQAQKTPEPNRRETRQKNRQQLAETETKRFVSFYQAVDFLETVPQAERDKIEGGLFASGILDALISQEGLILADDLQILPEPQFFSATLADYLQVTNELAPELQTLVADILQSIMVDELMPGLPTIFQNGSYQVGNLKGAMPASYQGAYIGAASQARYRQQMISQLEAEIQVIVGQELDLRNSLTSKEELEEQMALDYKLLPDGEQVYQSIVFLNKIQLQSQAKEEQLFEKQGKNSQVEQQLMALKVDLHELTREDGLILTKEAFQDALNYVENYEANIIDSYRTYENLQNYQKIIDISEGTVAELKVEVADYFRVVADLTSDQEKQERLVVENQKQQSLINVAELQQQLAQARDEQKGRRRREAVLTEEISNLNRLLGTVEVELKGLTEELRENQFKEKYWQELLVKETNHLKNDENTLKALAKEKMRSEDFNSLRNLENNLLSQFNFISNQLNNYNPKLINYVAVELPKEVESKLGEFIQYSHYKQPSFISESQSHSTIELLEKLTSQQITLRDLLKKDDEELFKSIILESVGNVLRGRIYHGMKWVEKMNQLLQSQKNSSGLSLSIQWKAAPSTSEKDLGTARLVELLEKPPEILSQEDRQAIAQHFQEKVYYAQEQLRENPDDNSSLFQAIAQALDYRDWFTFEIKFKRGNEGYSPQVLSDRKFNQFSGGEKAISMYLPLFAAVSSRYQDASSECPKVITLDEAFAGIDDENISELFKACEQLEFNYVMNSQALFGDYPTVSSLMIYELLRPQNINLVTAIRYYWDGHKKQLRVEATDE